MRPVNIRINSVDFFLIHRHDSRILPTLTAQCGGDNRPAAAGAVPRELEAVLRVLPDIGPGGG